METLSMKSKLTRGNLDRLNTQQRANVVRRKNMRDIITVSKNTLSNNRALDGGALLDMKSKVTQQSTLEKGAKSRLRTSIIIPYANLKESQRDQALTTQALSGQHSPDFKRSANDN